MSGLTGTTSIAADYEFTTLTTSVPLSPRFPLPRLIARPQRAWNDRGARRTYPDP